MPRRVVPIAFHVFAICLLVFSVLVRIAIEPVTVGRAFYIWSSVFNLFVVSVFWSLLADLIGPQKAKALFGPIAAGGTLSVNVTGGTSGVPADAQAVLVSVTTIHAAGGTGYGNLRVFPAGSPVPDSSNINYVSTTSDVANFAIVQVGTGGQISLYSDGSPINATVDVLGYVPAGS